MSLHKILLASGILNLAFWSYKVTNYFFDYHPADELGLLISIIVPFLISKNFGGNKKISFWWSCVALVTSTLLLYPLQSYGLQRTDYAWVLPNILFVVLGIILGRTNYDRLESSPALLLGGVVWFIPFKFIPDQSLFFDRLLESKTTRQGKIHRVQWKGEQWIHYNGRLTASTIDAHLYYEPLVHPAMSLAGQGKDILLIGGENGLALTEIVKYDPRVFDIIPLDAEFLKNSRVHADPMITEAPFSWLHETSSLYDVIVLDLPDPIDISTNQYYTLEFYELCLKHLRNDGLLVTQASSPYFSPNTHYSIQATIEAAGLQTVNYHNQVPTIGQWGWVIATSGEDNLKTRLKNAEAEVTTRWWNQEAMQMMLSFGKRGYFDQKTPVINTIKSPFFLSKP